MATYDEPSENFGEPESELDNPNLTEEQLEDMIDALVNGHPIFEQPWVAEDTVIAPVFTVSPDGTYTYFVSEVFAPAPKLQVFKPSRIPNTLREWVEGE